ncbi:Protein RRC1 [Zea mays]|jgi:hypothetical protein|uniref:Protein RRC1 n=1 Tax=Zea mays TaxID=4577 RepID=A0A1D6H2E9_MAIZE|nr:Protein RRC1 [Zea mays]
MHYFDGPTVRPWKPEVEPSLTAMEWRLQPSRRLGANGAPVWTRGGRRCAGREIAKAQIRGERAARHRRSEKRRSSSSTSKPEVELPPTAVEWRLESSRSRGADDVSLLEYNISELSTYQLKLLI